MTPQTSFVFDSVRRALGVVAAIGVMAFALGALASPVEAWSAFLTSSFFFVTLALGGLVFLAVTRLANARWHEAIRLAPEAMAGYLPFAAASGLLLLVGIPWLYRWAHVEALAGDAALQAKAAWLNVPAFVMRLGAILAIWTVFGFLFHRTRREGPLSAGFLVVFALTFPIACADWLMSLQPHWASTIFGLYHMGGLLLGTVAAISVVVVVLRRRGLLPGVTEAHLHDLGKLVFAFSTLWAYLWFSQYLLIWYTNFPEETSYYLARTHGAWGVLFWGGLAIGWLIPFLALLPSPAKRSEGRLLAVGLLVLLGRWIDLHLAVAPAVKGDGFPIGVLDVVVLLGFAAWFLLVLVHGLDPRAASVPAPTGVGLALAEASVTPSSEATRD